MPQILLLFHARILREKCSVMSLVFKEMSPPVAFRKINGCVSMMNQFLDAETPAPAELQHIIEGTTKDTNIKYHVAPITIKILDIPIRHVHTHIHRRNRIPQPGPVFTEETIKELEKFTYRVKIICQLHVDPIRYHKIRK